jgi:hypothetical protein
METTLRHHPKHLPNSPKGNPLSGEEGTINSIAADIFDFDLKNLLDVAQKERAPTGLPSVDEFDFEEGCRAQDIARKFRPRTRYRSANRGQASFPYAQNEQNARRDPDRRISLQKSAASRVRGRVFFWGSCAAILLSTSSVVRQLNDDQISDRSDISASVEVVDRDSISDDDILFAQPMAAAALRSGSIVSVPYRVRPTATGGGSDTVDQSEPPAATSELALDSGASAPKPGTNDGPATSIVTPPSDATPAAAPDRVSEVGSSTAVSQDRSQIESAATLVERAVSGTARTNTTPLTAVQIDHLLTRGEELLQRVDIASARLLFLRVAAAGDRRGAKGVGMTYDPRVHAQLSVTDLAPDREQAEIWYQEAQGELDLPDRPYLTTDRSEARAKMPEAQAPGLEEWNAACARKYRSFEPSTGLFTTQGGVKRRCRLT